MSFHDVLKRCLYASRDLAKRYGFDSSEHGEFVAKARSFIAQQFGESAEREFAELCVLFRLGIQLVQKGSASPELRPLLEKHSDDGEKEVES